VTDLARWPAVLFDLDGTLADTVELILRCYRHTMKEHLGEAPPDARFLATIGRPLPVQLLDFARDDAQHAAMRQTYVEFQRGIHDDMVSPFPGADDVLRRLKEAGTKVGVVTSKASRLASRTLDCCGLLHHVDFLICADQVERPKPDPESVLRALAHFGLAERARDVVFVGDSPFDLQAGRGAGTRTAAALWGPFAHEVLLAETPDYMLDRLEDVLEMVP